MAMLKIQMCLLALLVGIVVIQGNPRRHHHKKVASKERQGQDPLESKTHEERWYNFSVKLGASCWRQKQFRYVLLPCILLRIFFALVSLKFSHLERLFLKEKFEWLLLKMLSTFWKRRRNGATHISIHVRFLSCVILLTPRGEGRPEMGVGGGGGKPSRTSKPLKGQVQMA